MWHVLALQFHVFVVIGLHLALGRGIDGGICRFWEFIPSRVTVAVCIIVYVVIDGA